MSRTSQVKRAAIFAQQNKQCALCGQQETSMVGWSYKLDQNTMICKQCNTSLGNYCSALSRGVTPAMMAAFLVREPAPEPTGIGAPTGTRPDTLIIDGERCTVVDGEWVPVDQPEPA